VAKDATCKAKTITLEAQSRLVLKVGSSQVELTASGITIKASTVKIDAASLDAKGSGQFKLSGGSGNVQASGPLGLKGLQLTAEGSAMTTVKAGGMLTLQASGMTTVKGGIVQIN
jgi:type VI secretion system secreted protein VgrG